MSSLTRIFARATLSVTLVVILGIPVGCQKKAAVTKESAPVASAKPVEKPAEPKSELPKFELPKPADDSQDLLAMLEGAGKPAVPQQGQAPEIRVGPRPPGAPQAPIETKPTAREEIRKALEDIRIAIDNYSLASGQMPSPQLTYTIVKQAAPQYAALIESQKILINAARNREEIWAYEYQSDAKRIYVLFATGVEEMEMSAFRRRLGR